MARDGWGEGGRGWVGKDETKTQVWDEPIEEVKVEGSQNNVKYEK